MTFDEVSAKPEFERLAREINLGDYIFLPEHNLYIAKQKTFHGKNWYQAHEELHKQKAWMLTLREFVDFLLLLKQGKVQDGLGNLISKQEVQTVYNEITKMEDPWRAEWIDAYFSEQPNTSTLTISYNHRTSNGKLQPQNTESLEQCLIENCRVNIKEFNRQGMPTKEGNDFSYWYPMNGRVARFSAYSVMVDLNCCGVPSYSDPALGVRAARTP